LRIQTHMTIMLAWWAVRWARHLHEVPLGLDARLVDRPAGWLAGVERHYHRYLAQAQARLVAQGPVA
jgi:hypothetical protein